MRLLLLLFLDVVEEEEELLLGTKTNEEVSAEMDEFLLLFCSSKVSTISLPFLSLLQDEILEEQEEENDNNREGGGGDERKRKEGWSYISIFAENITPHTPVSPGEELRIQLIPNEPSYFEINFPTQVVDCQTKQTLPFFSSTTTKKMNHNYHNPQNRNPATSSSTTTTKPPSGSKSDNQLFSCVIYARICSKIRKRGGEKSEPIDDKLIMNSFKELELCASETNEFPLISSLQTPHKIFKTKTVHSVLMGSKKASKLVRYLKLSVNGIKSKLFISLNAFVPTSLFSAKKDMIPLPEIEFKIVSRQIPFYVNLERQIEGFLPRRSTLLLTIPIPPIPVSSSTQNQHQIDNDNKSEEEGDDEEQGRDLKVDLRFSSFSDMTSMNDKMNQGRNRVENDDQEEDIENDLPIYVPMDNDLSSHLPSIASSRAELVSISNNSITKLKRRLKSEKINPRIAKMNRRLKQALNAHKHEMGILNPQNLISPHHTNEEHEDEEQEDKDIVWDGVREINPAIYSILPGLTSPLFEEVEKQTIFIPNPVSSPSSSQQQQQQPSNQRRESERRVSGLKTILVQIWSKDKPIFFTLHSSLFDFSIIHPSQTIISVPSSLRHDQISMTSTIETSEQGMEITKLMNKEEEEKGEIKRDDETDREEDEEEMVIHPPIAPHSPRRPSISYSPATLSHKHHELDIPPPSPRSPPSSNVRKFIQSNFPYNLFEEDDDSEYVNYNSYFNEMKVVSTPISIGTNEEGDPQYRILKSPPHNDPPISTSQLESDKQRAKTTPHPPNPIILPHSPPNTSHWSHRKQIVPKDISAHSTKKEEDEISDLDHAFDGSNPSNDRSWSLMDVRPNNHNNQESDYEGRLIHLTSNPLSLKNEGIIGDQSSSINQRSISITVPSAPITISSSSSLSIHSSLRNEDFLKMSNHESILEGDESTEGVDGSSNGPETGQSTQISPRLRMFKFSSVGKLGYKRLMNEYKSPSTNEEGEGEHQYQKNIKKSKRSQVQPSLPHSCYNILTTLIEPNLRNDDEISDDRSLEWRPKTTHITPKPPPQVSFHF